MSVVRARVAGCATCAKADFPFAGGNRCAYCEAPLSSRHEHDHVPLPKRHGGKQVVPVCINCHDLKDRIAFEDWDAATFFEAMQGATPLGRIIVAKVVSYMHDVTKDRAT